MKNYLYSIYADCDIFNILLHTINIFAFPSYDLVPMLVDIVMP